MGIFLAITSILGFILFLINVILFDSVSSNFNKIAFGFFSLVPVFGVIIMILSIGWDASHYKRDGFGTSICTNEIYVRRIRINRWLFNDINWKEWDEHVKRCERFDEIES